MVQVTLSPLDPLPKAGHLLQPFYFGQATDFEPWTTSSTPRPTIPPASTSSSTSSPRPMACDAVEAVTKCPAAHNFATPEVAKQRRIAFSFKALHGPRWLVHALCP